MDYTNRFVVYNKIEISRLENRIEDLVRENERLKEMGQKCRELEFENINLKNQLNHRKSLNNESTTIQSLIKVSDQGKTINFIQDQKVPDIKLEDNLLSSNSSVPNGNQNHQINSYLNDGISTDTAEFTNDSSIGFADGCVRRKSNFDITNGKKDYPKDNGHINQTKSQHKLLENQWSFPTLSNTNGLSELAKEMRNKCDKNMMFKIIAKEWNKKSESMGRMEFFYHLLTMFIENGVLITFCTEHNPPCSPRVDAKILEKNADVLKTFVNSVNRYKLIVIEVEMLVALENVIYAQPKYRPAASIIMDILFSKGVIEAVAFSEWSQMDSNRNAEKVQLIREIKASGFCLLKRSSSL